MYIRTYVLILMMYTVHHQGTILVVPPYPYCIEEDRIDVPLKDCWYARPQLFFTCQLRPKGGRVPLRNYKKGPDDLLLNFVFFSTFEELSLPIKGPMEGAGVVKLYEPSPTPCLYVAPAENMVGRVPLIPLFLAGNATPTIPHIYSKRKDSGFPMGCADAATEDGRRGSNVYEVNPWLWMFGRGKPRLGGLTVAETAERQIAKAVDRKKRAAETRQRRKALRA